ncbi:MAG: ABC transporter substrate-binding protein [Synergistales bacterium]|nr:ABC transporter substrate-binding protein [Synergistales bacterium]
MVAFVIAVAMITACPAGVVQAAGEPVVLASKIDTEGALLGNMMKLLMEDAGIPVENRISLGPTNVVRKAIRTGEIDLYPEYTGNGAYFFNDTGTEVWKDPEQGYRTVKRLDAEANDLVWLEPAPSNNTWAIAVRMDLAEREGLETLDDLAAYINEGGRFKLACSEEFVTRPGTLPAFEKTYGFSLDKEQLLILSGGNTAQTEQAAARGTSGVNAAMAYGTDGALSALNLRVLEDNRNVQPVYEPAPLVRAETLEAYPQLEELFAPVFASLDLTTLQRLNAAIAVQGRDPEAVAREYLRQEGFLP